MSRDLSDARAEIERLQAQRQAVIDCINLYGEETLHKALDAVGFVVRDGELASECCDVCAMLKVDA